MEAFKQPILLQTHKINKYEDLLRKDGTLKNNIELERQGTHLDWWTRMQLESRYAKDKLQGFYLEQTLFGKLSLESNKLIKKT